MLVFNPQDPYPLLSEDSLSYAEAQAHSEIIDDWLGLRIKDCEAALSARLKPASSTFAMTSDENLWVDLPSRTLMTPYTELRFMLSRVAPLAGQTVVDLGAAYGRMGFVIDRCYPGVHFIGYEFVRERAEEGARCYRERGVSPLVRLVEADLSDKVFTPITADIYFMYDYGSRSNIDKTLYDIKSIARERSVRVIARGRATRDAIERREPWLSQVVEPEHHAHYSIFTSSVN